MKKHLLLSLILISVVSQAQIGKIFPILVGETLDERKITIPTDTKGKVTIIGVAYAKKAEETLSTWYTPFYDKFILKRGIFDHKYDVNLYFIPMFSGLKKVTYEANIKELKESNRKDLFPHLLFYKGEIDSYISSLEMSDKNHPYFFVLDETGKIRYSTFGLFTEGKMEKIEEVLDETW